MPGISDFLENKLLDHTLKNTAYTSPATVYASLHTADPVETGASEVTGGSYARQAITFGAAAAGQSATTATLNFTGMPAVGGDGVTHIGIWDALTVGNFLFGGPLGGTIKYFTVQTSDLAADLITSPGHGLAADNRVEFEAGLGGSLPTGLSANTIYFVISTGLTADVFKVSTTQGGGAVNITAVGEGYLKVDQPKTTNSGDTFQVASGSFTVALD